MGASHEITEQHNGIPERLGDSTAYLLSRAVRDAARRAQTVFGHETLRFPHYVTASWIEYLGPTSQVRLARAMVADPSDLVTVLTELETAGFVDRARDPHDGRRHVVQLTAAGATWLENRGRLARRFDDDLGAQLPDQGSELRSALRALIQIEPHREPPGHSA